MNGAQSTLHEIDGIRHHLYLFSNGAQEMSLGSKRALDPCRRDFEHESTGDHIVRVEGRRQIPADADAVFDLDSPILALQQDAHGWTVLSTHDLHVVELETFLLDEGLDKR